MRHERRAAEVAFVEQLPTYNKNLANAKGRFAAALAAQPATQADVQQAWARAVREGFGHPPDEFTDCFLERYTDGAMGPGCHHVVETFGPVHYTVGEWMQGRFSSGDSIADVLATPGVPPALVGIWAGGSFSSMPPGGDPLGS